jgi:hypothetical protein
MTGDFELAAFPGTGSDKSDNEVIIHRSESEVREKVGPEIESKSPGRLCETIESKNRWSRDRLGYSSIRAPPSHCPMLNTTNSAGFTGQMPTCTFT